jgi:hypothetical protein
MSFSLPCSNAWTSPDNDFSDKRFELSSFLVPLYVVTSCRCAIRRKTTLWEQTVLVASTDYYEKSSGLDWVDLERLPTRQTSHWTPIFSSLEI